MTSSTRPTLTLTDIHKLTGLSYPTLLRLFKNHRDRIPHAGTGRATRYPSEAAEVFKQLEAGKKPPPGGR